MNIGIDDGQGKGLIMNSRPYIGVTFKCCNVYARIYLNKEGTAFTGVCPRCYRNRIEVKVVERGGSNDRFFEAG